LAAVKEADATTVDTPSPFSFKEAEKKVIVYFLGATWCNLE
jgi:hypothetical protein